MSERLKAEMRCENCGMPIDVHLELEGEPELGSQFAITCDCGKTHWMTWISKE